ncbi:hypothetical protein GGF46_000629 [Coemansia sp. RSA 552]|nr:hypothetical protein GGF46_000629 [Coemansia sp. RSA 552]
MAVVQYHQWASMIMVDVIGVIGFNRELRALETGSHELSQVLGRVRDLGFITMVFPWIKCLPRFIAQRTGTLNRLVAYGREAIESHRQTPLPNEINLLQTLGSSRMTDPQIISETILHLVAGVDTTAAGITWTLALLIHNPQVLRRLVAEIRSEFPPDSDSPHISYEGCCLRLPYLAAVIAESMRVLPPVPNITPRLAPPGGVRLGGYLIPAGTWICPAIDSIHRNPAHFPKPDSFNPDRFLAPGPEQQCLVAFSAGVRACIGRNLALLVMNLVLANLLRNYDLQAPGSAKPESNPTATVDLDDKATTGSVPDIPRRTQATTTPTNPDRDCLVLVSLPAQA